MRSILFYILLALAAAPAAAQEAPQPPRDEFPSLHEFSEQEDGAAVSPKPGWSDFEEVEEKERPWYLQVLLWFPNRVLDLLDVFHVDVGAGPAYGAVARITRYGQVGYRDMAPASLRFGLFGREAPFLMERSSEFGIGPAFVDSKDRVVCGGELGVGADVFIVGAYGGICVEELADFVAGVFFLDIMDDDLR